MPAENLLVPPRGDGLTIAYHGLNLGRVALCANASGTMRVLLANMLPWAHYRKTYGEAIVRRELVRRRMGRLAGLIVACDALVDWCAGLLDEGYRGEMECIVAKIFGSEALKEAAVELFMKTHGGRSFLHGHLFGDNVHEYLAPCIYEGEGEMLGMAFFKSLVKHHGTRFFEPIGKALAAAGIKKPNPLNPAHAWALRGAIGPYARWVVGEKLARKSQSDIAADAGRAQGPRGFCLRLFAAVAADDRRASCGSTSLRWPTGNAACRTFRAKSKMRWSFYAPRSSPRRQTDEIMRGAADLICQDLTRKLTGQPPSDRYFRAVTKLGEQIADGGFQAVAGLDAAEILMRYD